MIATLAISQSGNIHAERLSDGQLVVRFVGSNDQDAFAALVRRHRSRVLNVCRRLLRDHHDAEDACQITFLVLLRRARSLAEPELLANWLHGVARRVAGKARAQAARQRLQETSRAADAVPDPLTDVLRRDLQSLLVTEMQRLPEKYRASLVLCYLDGKTNAEAAQQLGCPAGSMSHRLARGREMLRQRLIQVRKLRFPNVTNETELPEASFPNRSKQSC
jgi:RNA polymerase sigma factor (sigma-70 family)